MQQPAVIQLRNDHALIASQRINLSRPGTRHPELIRVRNCDGAQINEQRLQQALRMQEFGMVYQTCHEATTGRVTGIEAMVRWHHPELGMILPGQFLGIAERSSNESLITGIWEFVLNESLSQLTRWRQQGLIAKDIAIALNVSPSQIAHGENRLLDSINTALSTYSLPSSALELDFAKAMPLSVCSKTAKLFGQLSNLGIKLALDDFGTGSFDLRQVMESHVDVIKIDRSLAQQMSHNDRYKSIIQSLVAHCQRVGTRVVIEGVETALQANCVTQIGADCAQGYYYCHPVSGIEFNRLCTTL